MSQKTTNFLSRSLLIQGGHDAVHALARALGVDEPHRFFDAGEGVTMALGQQRSSLTAAAIAGDFSWSVDLYLFGVSSEALVDALRAHALAERCFALPDDHSDNPFHYTVYEQGLSRQVSIVENEDSSVFTIYPR
jgi:hypothetical protein